MSFFFLLLFYLRMSSCSSLICWKRQSFLHWIAFVPWLKINDFNWELSLCLVQCSSLYKQSISQAPHLWARDTPSGRFKQLRNWRQGVKKPPNRREGGEAESGRRKRQGETLLSAARPKSHPRASLVGAPALTPDRGSGDPGPGALGHCPHRCLWELMWLTIAELPRKVLLHSVSSYISS